MTYRFIDKSEKGGRVSGGTEFTAIWPSDVVCLYTILSLEEASVQDVAGSVPTTRAPLSAPDPASVNLLLALSASRDPPFLASRRSVGYGTSS